MILRLLAAALLCVLMTQAVDARPRHHFVESNKVIDCSSPFIWMCGRRIYSEVIGYYGKPANVAQHPRRRRLSSALARVMAEGAGRVVGGRPRGCPRRYCGCGASLHVFGRIIPSLNLAANWLRFPRAMPVPGMVAARRGHVFVLERHMRGNVWWVYDANSGRHLTRIHPRSIAGFRIVNPHGSRLALQ